MSNKKCICFVYTETTGLHKDMKEDVSKKKLFLYARLVVLNYEIGYIENGEYVQEKQVRSIVKPRSMVITEDSVQFHGITNDHALKEGIEIEEVLVASIQAGFAYCSRLANIFFLISAFSVAASITKSACTTPISIDVDV